MNPSGEAHDPVQERQDGCSANPGPSTGPAQQATINTSNAFPSIDTQVAMTLTPASAITGTSASGFNSPLLDSHSTKAQAPSLLSALPDSMLPPPPPLSSSPAGSRSTMADQAIPESSPLMPTRPTAVPGAMAEALSASRSPGLIRRLSRGAHNKLRRRASTNHSMRLRDQSAGPIIYRRRSDSNGASDLGMDVSDLELDSTADDVDDFLYPSPITERNNPLGIDIGRRNPTSNNTTIFEGGIAPASSAVLEAGTWLTKVTKRKTKRIKLWLDSNSARVCWHSTKTSKSFCVDDVQEVRVGADSRNARDDVQIPDDQEGRWVTIVYHGTGRSKGRTIKTMHVLMPDDFILKLWTDALNMVSRERIEVMNALSTSTEKSETSMALAWRQAMARKGSKADEGFSLDDARWLCRRLEINCSDNTIRTHFKTISADESSLLNYSQYRSFVHSFRDRKDIQHIYRNVRFGTDLDMDLNTFLEFLKNEQMIDIARDPAHWEEVFNKYARPSQNRSHLPDAQPVVGQRVLNTQSFQGFLTSSYNSPLVPLRVEPTLDKSLNEYFISSSHNTYLLGRQVAGASSVEGYIAALVKGCRCIEIDCWDGDDGRPMVTHGRTMSTKVPFEDCVSVIAKYAFNSSPYPLIVSLEVHCNPEQQLAMVELMRKYFLPMMLTQSMIPNPASLPSPEELKGRILIKVKASEDGEQSHSLVDSTNGRSRARSLGSAFTRTPSETSQPMYSPVIPGSVATSPTDSNDCSTPHGSLTSEPVMTPTTSADDSDGQQAALDKAKKRKIRIIPELGKLGVYTQGIKFQGFQTPDAKTFNHVYSFSEATFAKHSAKATDSKALLEKHNTRYLMRVYPAQWRIDSSNFNPLQSWRRGVQMAALNWQTYDVHQQINEAMFAAGLDRFGYVLKPDELRHAKHLPIADTVLEAPEKKEKKGKKLLKFSVDIISAQRLPRPRDQNNGVGMNPYIEFEMFTADDKVPGIATTEGGPDPALHDATSLVGTPARRRTRIVEGNGFDPQYNQHLTMQVITKFPSLIFVRWTVWNAPEGRSASNNVLLATFTAKLSNLQQGYRHLPLFNPQGEQYRDAKLFVKIRKEVPVPLEREDNAYGFMEAQQVQSPSIPPRPELPRAGRTWPRRINIFARNASRRREQQVPGDPPGTFSRTSSMEREFMP